MEKSICFDIAPNGLRMVCLTVPGSAVGYFGVAVRVGSRDESSDSHGLAHFVEHTIFKGTARRRSWHIINRMEAVGGELNAFTSKEETVVFSAFPDAGLPRAAELIGDLVANSQFPARELDKEREVVADEIDSYLDSPAEAVFDEFDEAAFAGSSLAHNILGSRRALEGFDTAVCRAYLAKWYVPANMVAFYVGPQPPSRVFRVVSRAFAHMTGAAPAVSRAVPEVVPSFNITRPIPSHQAHTVIGARIGSMSDPTRFADSLLANILGGPGMNSLLNVALRERRGLVYSVDASRTLLSDCGMLTIYYGCDPADNERCRRLVLDTIRSVADGALTPRSVEAAKKQYLGQLVIAGENIENRILSIAHQYLFTGAVSGQGDINAAISAVTAADVAERAASLALSSLTLGL